ncbi:MAG: outer membrane protein assembly factor [Candidatus Bipolaricaulia bacterium]
MEKRLLGALFVCLALAGAACAAAEFPLYVTAVEIHGNSEIGTNRILREVSFDIGDTVTEQDIRDASQKIYDLGWFTEVIPQVDDSGAIAFRVTETPVIEEYEITGNVYRKDYSLLGVKLFDAPIVPTSTIRSILRENGVKKRQILHLPSLRAALEEIVEKYADRGYLLVAIGDVKPEAVLKIPVIEARVIGNVVRGLETVPQAVADELLSDLPLDQPLKKTELQKVVAALRESVFFSSVDVQPLQGPEADTVYLQWVLTERSLISTPVAFTTVALDGVTRFPIDVASLAMGDIPEGIADNYAVLRMLEPLYNLYYDAGFIMVAFTLDRLAGDTLYLRVKEGLISQILIAEGTETQGRVLRRNLALHVGRVLTYNDLRVSYQKLNSLGYFDSVVIDPVWGDDGVHVQVSVTDKETRGGVNGSVAVDPSTGALTGKLSVSQKNLLGTGQDISVSYNRELADGDDPTESTWMLGYSTVAYFAGFDKVEANVYRTLTDDDDEDEATTYLTIGGTVTFGFPVADYTDLELSYAHEKVRDVEQTEWTPVEIFGVALAEDSSDDPYSPSRGTRRSVSIQKAGGFSIGEEFTKLEVNWVRFTPAYTSLFSDDVECTWATRSKLGWGTQDLSSTYAYDFGGSTSVRGFTDESEEIDRIFIVNAEYRVRPVEGLTAASFFDWGVDLERIRAEDMLASTGFELGILVAGILVRLDVIWVFGDGAGWVPRFDFAFGSMF